MAKSSSIFIHCSSAAVNFVLFSSVSCFRRFFFFNLFSFAVVLRQLIDVACRSHFTTVEFVSHPLLCKSGKYIFFCRSHSFLHCFGRRWQSKLGSIWMRFNDQQICSAIDFSFHDFPLLLLLLLMRWDACVRKFFSLRCIRGSGKKCNHAASDFHLKMKRKKTIHPT